MNFLDIILLGLIQGFTEFFPVSSSGHLLIGKTLLEVKENPVLIDIILHLGTLLSIVVFWRKDLLLDSKNIINGESKIYLKLIIGCIPVGCMYVFYNTEIENRFFNVNWDNTVPLFLIVNYAVMSAIIFITKYFHDNNKLSITYYHAFLIGCAQCFALMPGISRSGITIAAALLLGYTFKKSMKFSFYLAIPTIFFGSLLKIREINNLDSFTMPFIGFIFSFIFGYFILIFLDRVILQKKYWYFSVYCLIISLFLLVYKYGY